MRSVWIAGVLVCGCSSEPTPNGKPRPEPAVRVTASSKWTIQNEWSGGKPPGTRTEVLLRSNGHFLSSSGASVSAPASSCDVVVDGSLIAPITAVLVDTKLDPGVPAQKQNGSIVTSTILTVDDEGYAMPGSTAFQNAVDAAMVSGSKLCAEQIRSRKP